MQPLRSLDLFYLFAVLKEIYNQWLYQWLINQLLMLYMSVIRHE